MSCIFYLFLNVGNTYGPIQRSITNGGVPLPIQKNLVKHAYLQPNDNHSSVDAEFFHSHLPPILIRDATAIQKKKKGNHVREELDEEDSNIFSLLFPSEDLGKGSE